MEIKKPIAPHLIEEELIPKEIPPFINDRDSLNTSILEEEINKPLPPIVVAPERLPSLAERRNLAPVAPERSPSLAERRNLDPIPPITTSSTEPLPNTNPFTPPISATADEPIRPIYDTTNPFLCDSPVEEDQEEEARSVHSKEGKSTGHHLNLTFSRHSEPGEPKKHHLFHNPFKHLTRHTSIQRPDEEQEREESPRLFSTNTLGLKRDSSTRRNALHGPFLK